VPMKSSIVSPLRLVTAAATRQGPAQFLDRQEMFKIIFCVSRTLIEIA
jgi:hypothetical protein